MANKLPTLFILKVLVEGCSWGSTASRATINENYFYSYIYTQSKWKFISTNLLMESLHGVVVNVLVWFGFFV